MFLIPSENKNENCLQKTCICEKERDLNLTMTMENVVAFTKSSCPTSIAMEWGRQT